MHSESRQSQQRMGVRIVKQLLLAIASLACALQFLYIPLVALDLEGVWKILLVHSPVGVIYVWPVLSVWYIFVTSRCGRWGYCAILLIHTAIVGWWLSTGGSDAIRETFQEVYYGIAFYGVAWICAWLAMYYVSHLYPQSIAPREPAP